MEEGKEEEVKEHEDMLDENVKKHSWKGLVVSLIIVIFVFYIVFNFNNISNLVNTYVIKSGDLYETPDDRTYNGFGFTRCESKWCTEVRWANRIVKVPLQFAPWELEDVPITGRVNDQFIQSQELYITFDPAEDILSPSGAVVKEKLGHLTLSVTELTLNLVRGMNFTTIAACTKEDEGCEDRPILTCNNTNQSIIYFKRSDDTKVTLDENCITIEGREWNIVKATDRLLLYWYGIMQK